MKKDKDTIPSTGTDKEKVPMDQVHEVVSSPDIVPALVENTIVIQEAAPAAGELPHVVVQERPAPAPELSVIDDDDDVQDLEDPVIVEDALSPSMSQEEDAEEIESDDNGDHTTSSNLAAATCLDDNNAGAPAATGAVVSDSEQESLAKKRSFLFRLLDSHGCGYVARFPERWPRTFWFWFGVVAPLWMLIGIATVCGYGLAKLEAPQEIVTNDFQLEINHRVRAVEVITNSIMEKTPRICMRLYQKNSTTPEEFPQLDYEEGYYESAILLEQATREFLNDDEGTVTDWVIDGNDLLEFMSQCGKNFQRYISRIQAAGVVYVGEPADLTFNWARCVNDTADEGILDQITVDLPFVGEKTYQALHPQAQAEYYELVWFADMERINQTVYDGLQASPNATEGELILVRGEAFLEATRLATGGNGCKPNLHAGSWFFFTVMTTIGYGNQAPRTVEGRSMLFTVGFLSILVFAATTVGAGFIMTSLFDDMMKKGHIGCLGRPIFATCFWGATYYTWLLLIAAYTSDWKNTRLPSDDFDYGDGYWFAFISTTTVGLGDIYLDPEVVVSQDLLGFSLLFLIGFVFLASFLGSLGSFLKRLERVGGSSLQDNLDKTTICCGHKVVMATYHAGEVVVKEGHRVGEVVVKKGYHAGEVVIKKSHHVGEIVVKKGYHAGEAVVKAGHNASESVAKASHHAIEAGQKKMHRGNTEGN